jgi:hypothetical protein
MEREHLAAPRSILVHHFPTFLVLISFLPPHRHLHRQVHYALHADVIDYFPRRLLISSSPHTTVLYPKRILMPASSIPTDRKLLHREVLPPN